MKPVIDVNGKNVCMVMAYTGQNAKFVEMGEFASRVNMGYCARHKYGFRLYTSGFAEDRHPSWSKLLFLRDTLKDYPWAFWVDADAIVTNPVERLERFLDDRYMMIAGKQEWGGSAWWNAVNCGVFFVRNDPDVGEFFDKVWADMSRDGRVGWEQDGVRECIKKEPWKSKVKVVCRRDFNSMVNHPSLNVPDWYPLWTEAWYKGDFIAHFGGKRTDVIEAMKAILAESRR